MSLIVRRGDQGCDCPGPEPLQVGGLTLHGAPYATGAYRAAASPVFIFTVKVTKRESALWILLELFPLMGASPDFGPVTVAGECFRFSSPSCWNGCKMVQLSRAHW